MCFQPEFCIPWIPLGSQPGTTPDPLAGFEGPLLGKGEGRKEREGKRKGREGESTLRQINL